MKALNLFITLSLISLSVYADEQSYATLRFMSSQAKREMAKKRLAQKNVHTAKQGKWVYNGFLDTTSSNKNLNKRNLKRSKKSDLYAANSSSESVKSNFDFKNELNTEVSNFKKVEEQKSEEKKWGISLTSENMKNATNDNPAGYNGDIFAVQTAAFKYKFQDTLSGQIAQDWYQLYGRGQNSEGKENESDITVQDLSFRVTKMNVLKSNNISWLIQGRYYAPTSEASQDVGQLGQIRLYFIGESQIAPKITASLLSSPRYFMQRNKSIDNEDGSETNTNHWRILNSLGFKYSFNDTIALETTGGVYSKKKNNEQMKHFQDFSTSLYLNYSLFSLNFGIRASDEALDIRDNGFEFYNNRVSEYFAIFSISI